jgi:hypothetical protein
MSEFLVYQPVRSAYQPPASSTFLSEQTSHQQPVSSTLLSEQTSSSHQPPANRTGCIYGCWVLKGYGLWPTIWNLNHMHDPACLPKLFLAVFVAYYAKNESLDLC